MEVRMLGRPTVLDGHVRHTPRPGKTSAVLYLAAYRDGWIDRAELLAMFWPDSDETHARANLRQLLFAIRQQAFTMLPEIESARIRWRVSTDVHAFRASLDRDDVAATEIYRGPFLDGFRVPEAPAFEAWLGVERDALHQMFRRSTLRVGNVMTAAGRPGAAADLFARVLHHDPFDEEIARKRMLALHAAHGPAEALAYYSEVAATLESEMGLEPEPATTELAQAMRNPDACQESRSDALPRPPTRFVGRVAELARISRELTSSAVRFLNVTGPGGIGKTRLAIEIAVCVENAFPKGVAFVSLVPIVRPEEMVERIAAALSIPHEDSRSTLEAIAARYRTSAGLLVLDNLEQIDGAGGPIHELLRAAPLVTILGTSRTVLGIEGEVVRPLQGLGVPSGHTRQSNDVAYGGPSDAVELFLQAGTRMLPTYDPDASELDEIARVCRAAGGMPLAIELAAQWVRVLPAAEIADEVERGLKHLTRRSGMEDTRHGSVRTVFDRSWTRLAETQQHALMALSVFCGDFTFAHARHVAGVDHELLLGLVDRSLLQVRSAGRIGHHPLVRTYVRERSEQHPQVMERARYAHADRYANVFSEWSDQVFGHGDGEALRHIGAEIEDARAAWRFAVEAQRWDWIDALLPALNRYHDAFRLRGAFIELVEDALRIVPTTEPSWQRLVQVSVYHLMGEGRYEQAIAAADAAMADLRAHADPWRRAAVLSWTGVAHAKAGRRDVAARIWHEALAVPGIAARPRIEGRILANLSFVTLDVDEVDALFERGVCKARDDGSALDLNWMLRNRSIHVLRSYGRYPEAEGLAKEAVDRVRGFSEGNIVTALQNLAYIQLIRGRLAQAEATLSEADELTQRLDDPRRQTARTENVHLKAHLLADRGNPDAALDFCRELLVGSQSNMHRLLMTRLHLATGALNEADELIAELTRSAALQDGIRGRHYMVIMAELLAADLAWMRSDASLARKHTVRALELATQHTFVPAVLHALLLAAHVVQGRDRQVFSRVARAHPASTHTTRIRASHRMKGSDLPDGEAEQGTPDLLVVAREAIEMLRPCDPPSRETSEIDGG